MKKINGFSLAEALFVLLLIAIIAVLSAPLILRKTEKKIENAHGRWECTLIDDIHVQTLRDKNEKIKSGPEKVGDSCTFQPPSSAKDFQVDICGGEPLKNCKQEDGSRTVMFYSSLPRQVREVKFTNTTVEFGKFAFAFRSSGTGRVRVTY